MSEIETVIPTSRSVEAMSGDPHGPRRKRFMRQIGEQSAALIVSNPPRVRSNDTSYAYRPSSDLWYLTGCVEPESACLLLPGHPEHPFVMFVRKRDFSTEVWDGPRLGVEGAHERLGADRVFAIDELDEALPKLLVGRSMLVYDLGRHEEWDRRVVRAYVASHKQARSRTASPTSIVALTELLHELRLLKGPEEIDALREACRVTAEAHTLGMRKTRPGMAEYELQAEIEHAFRKAGARAPAYESIVGGGRNGCVLHYIENRDTLRDGDLVLVDAGAEVGWYAGDVTRTWPVNGRFEGRQRMIYDLVLRAQVAVIRAVKPGLPWTELHAIAVKTITQGLIDMELIEGPFEAALEQKAFRPFFMHGTGHWLGLDVHDVGLYARGGEKGRVLEPGMVFTVEPGVYFHPDEPLSPEEFKGIGVRIEDNILVTPTGCEVLTSAAPKEPEEIEAIVGN